MKILVFFRRSIILGLISIIFFYNETFAQNELKKVDFDISMGIQDKQSYGLLFKHKKSKEYMDFFRSLFNTNFSVPAKKKTIIPKIIHYVWIGNKPLPRLYKSYIETCKALHPKWEFKIWDNESIHQLKFNKRNYEKLEHLSCKKDLLFLSILKQYGGVALDLDYVCIKPLDELNHKYEFYAGLEPPNGWTKMPLVSLSLIASTVNSNFIKLTEGYFNKSSPCENIGREYAHCCASKALCISSALKWYCSHKNNNCNRVMIFPATYFNPMFKDPLKRVFTYNSYYHKIYYRIFKKHKLNIERNLYPYTKIYPETILIQDWYEQTNPLFLVDMQSKK